MAKPNISAKAAKFVQTLSRKQREELFELIDDAEATDLLLGAGKFTEELDTLGEELGRSLLEEKDPRHVCAILSSIGSA